VGRALADRLALTFVDLDALVEERTGRTIPAIFTEDGEEEFREMEVEATREVASGRERAVVAAGGGWMANRRAVALLRPVSRIVHLRVSPETAVLRLGGAAAARPLLAPGDALECLSRLLGRRRTDYSQADCEVDTESIAVMEVTESLVHLVKARGWGPR
jgi:shikimate kinase